MSEIPDEQNNVEEVTKNSSNWPWKSVTTVFLLFFVIGYFYLRHVSLIQDDSTIPEETLSEDLLVDKEEIKGLVDVEEEFVVEDWFVLDMPVPGATITSPLTVSGKARGFWFFEASAPFGLVDASGFVIAESYIQADGEWMTEDFVPFSGVLEFVREEDASRLYRGQLELYFKRDNPSDLPENDRMYSIPVTISE